MKSRWIVGVTGSLLLVAFAVVAEADERNWLLGLAVVGRSAEILSYSDSRPTSHLEAGGRTELAWRAGGKWWLGASGSFGGAWFDYLVPLASGNIEQTTWVVRGGVERELTEGSGMRLTAGLGAEYGESRSWLHAFLLSDEGPHTYLGGGYVKTGLSAPLAGPCEFHAELLQSIYHAHAKQARIGGDFNWMGASLEVSAGVRFFW
jgi:hypothetical protein